MTAFGQLEFPLSIQSLEAHAALRMVMVGHVVEDVAVDRGVEELGDLDHHLVRVLHVLRLLHDQRNVQEFQRPRHLLQPIPIPLGKLGHPGERGFQRTIRVLIQFAAREE